MPAARENPQVVTRPGPWELRGLVQKMMSRWVWGPTVPAIASYMHRVNSWRTGASRCVVREGSVEAVGVRPADNKAWLFLALSLYLSQL